MFFKVDLVFVLVCQILRILLTLSTIIFLKSSQPWKLKIALICCLRFVCSNSYICHIFSCIRIKEPFFHYLRLCFSNVNKILSPLMCQIHMKRMDGVTNHKPRIFNDCSPTEVPWYLYGRSWCVVEFIGVLRMYIM